MCKLAPECATIRTWREKPTKKRIENMKIITIKLNDVKNALTIAPKGSHPADCPQCNDPIFWA